MELEEKGEWMTQVVSVPAGFWIRVLPSIIDSLIVGAALHLLTGFQYVQSTDMTTAFSMTSANIVLAGIYAGAFYVWKGATLGKKVFSLEVVDHQTGAKISFLRGFFRDSIGKLVSVAPCFIGFIIAAFNKDKRALHDYIFDTRVVKKLAVVQFEAPVSGASVTSSPSSIASSSPIDQ